MLEPIKALLSASLYCTVYIYIEIDVYGILYCSGELNFEIEYLRKYKSRLGTGLAKV
jgi:hypothetical protein